MRWSRTTGFALIALGLVVVVSGALAFDPRLQKKKKLLAKPHANLAAVKPARGSAPVNPRTPGQPKVALGAAPPSVPAQPASPLAPAFVAPGQPVLLAFASDWSIFRAEKDGAKTCYSATQPKDTAPQQAARGPVYLYVTSYAPGTIKHELTVNLGFNVPKEGVTATIDGQDFPLSVGGDLAFPPNSQIQRDLLLAMRRGHTMLIRSSLGGAQSGVLTDAFSMLGVDDALRVIDAACATP